MAYVIICQIATICYDMPKDTDYLGCCDLGVMLLIYNGMMKAGLI